MCGWVAVIDAAAGVLLAGLIHAVGRRSGQPVSAGKCVGLAILFGAPAAVLFLVVWLFTRIG